MQDFFFPLTQTERGFLLYSCYARLRLHVSCFVMSGSEGWNDLKSGMTNCMFSTVCFDTTIII